MKQVDSKYTLVVISAKRARFITENVPELANSKSVNPVSIALREVAQGNVVWERTKTGIK